MITGDHVQTAVAIARECGIIPNKDEPVCICDLNESDALCYTIINPAQGTEQLRRFAEVDISTYPNVAITGKAMRALSAA